MSMCRMENGQKRKHSYPEGSNQCSKCNHVTTHGANFLKTKKTNTKGK